MKEFKSSLDAIDLYHESYFLNQVDGFKEYREFSGRFSDLFKRYQRNIELLDLRPVHSYLEYGCGRGEICIYHVLSGGSSVGVDYSLEAINLAIEKAKYVGASVCFHATSFSDFFPPDSSFDRILASEFIEHISEKEGCQFIKIAYKALKPGGRLLVFTHPNTLQRRFGYPLLRLAGLLVGKKLPKQQADTLSKHYNLYHLNEQNYFSLTKLAKESGFSKYHIGYDADASLHDVKLIKRLIKFIAYKTILRHIFLTNLYLIAEK